MADIFVRDVPETTVEAIDARAERLGLSRGEYLQRVLERERILGEVPVTVDDFGRVSGLAADLDDPAVIIGAWR